MIKLLLCYIIKQNNLELNTCNSVKQVTYLHTMVQGSVTAVTFCDKAEMRFVVAMSARRQAWSRERAIPPMLCFIFLS